MTISVILMVAPCTWLSRAHEMETNVRKGDGVYRRGREGGGNAALFWRARLFCRRQSGVYGLPFWGWRHIG